jgi:conjugal transfer pilus assembly protein TraI
MPLTEWLIKTGSDRYFIKWKSVDIDQDRLAANTTFLINRIIHPEAVQYMRDGSNKIVSGVMGVITRSIPNSENSTLKNIVYEIRKRVVERDAAIQPDHYGRMTVGSHLDPYILDAMRQLVDDKTWKINQPKSRIWFAKDGLYIVWSSAAEELFATMNANKTPGMPKRKDTLLDLMASAGIIDSENESHLFLISPPDTTISMLAIRIINPYSILKAQADSITPCSSVLVTGDSSSSPVISEKINEEEKQNIVDQETGEILTESNQAVECVPIANEENAANIPVQLTDSETVSQPLEVPVKQEEKVAQDEVKADADVVDIGDEARKTIAALPPHLSEVISALVQDINRLDDGNNSAFRTKEGFAISTDMLASYGFSSTDLIKELKELGWLWYPPGNKNAKVHVLERAGSKVTAIVLSMAIAKHIGCPIQQQRNNN